MSVCVHIHRCLTRARLSLVQHLAAVGDKAAAVELALTTEAELQHAAKADAEVLHSQQ